MSPDDRPVAIAGGGLAGLSAAYRLQVAGHPPFVLFEREPFLGGYCRTVARGRFRFDLGGHRFYTKNQQVHELVEHLLGDDLLVVDRVSRIFFRGRFADYPLTVCGSLRALGLRGALRALADYAVMRFRSDRAEPEQVTFEQWALRRFGRYLYEAYFRPYTEKTWGLPCELISADFAEQRIKKLSIREAVRDALSRSGEDESLIRRFYYPRYGFGQIPDALAATVQEPNSLRTSHEIVAIRHADGLVKEVVAEGADGERRQACRALVSSLPITDTVRMLEPAAPRQVTDAAAQLRYRSVVLLFVVLDIPRLSHDHWIYIPSQQFGLCRMHEPKNWSAEMAPPEQTGVVLEYFCQQGDERWTQPIDSLKQEAMASLVRMGLLHSADCLADAVRIGLPRAYPIYQVGYRQRLNVVREYLSRFGNLYNVGRNASFLYTSSDHYIDMGLKAAENVLGHEHDLAEIGRDRNYAETW